MPKRLFFALLMFTSAFITVVATTSFTKEDEWTLLLDKDLTKWETYLGYKLKGEFDGAIPTDDNGKEIAPIGYNNNVNNSFSVTQEDGDPVLKVSGEYYGCVFTKQEYSNYHLKLKVRWGDQKFSPRTAKLKDSGLVYHSIGECGKDFWLAWMLGQEFQIMEGHMGDYWNIATAAIDIRAFLPEGEMSAVANKKQPFLSFGEGTKQGFCMRNEDFETPAPGWTQLELICFEGKSLHIVDGHVVMVLQNSRYVKDGKAIPLTRGKIQLQSEGAEVFFKDIRIRALHELPEVYASNFK